MSRHRSPCCQRSMRKPCPTLARRHYGDSSGFSRRVSFRSSLYNVCAFGILLCIFGTFARGADAQFNCSKGCTCSPWISGNVKWTNVSCVGQGLTEVPKDGKNGADVFKLDISYNNISSIAITDFQFFTHLRELNMGYNFISTIPLETFTNLTNLQTLILAGNTDFASIYDPNIFSGTTIESLDLSHMKLSSIVKDMFKPLSKLKILNLGYNGITSLEANLFKNLILEQIILSGNQLTENGVHKNAFKNMSSPSISLDLSNNQISSVSSDALDDADVVTSLDLSYNKIESLDSLVFRDVPKLVTLNLAGNALTNLHSGLFEDNNDLISLNLRSNRLTTIPVTIFNNQPKISVDLSDNPYTCECAVRDFLYNLEYDLSKTIKNIDQTTCLDSSNTVQVYLDFWSDCSEGNLGSSCVNVNNCMVRNSECIAGKCACESIYYDNNGNTTAGGLCKSMVNLDYPCTMDAACKTVNASCSNSKCQCKPLFYDDNPLYLGGNCYLMVELGVACTLDQACLANYSHCGSSGKCECQAAYYDNDDTNNVGGTCLPKKALHASCNATYQCAPANSECSDNTCECLPNFYDFNNVGTCQGPSNFYSCAPDNSTSLDSKEVHFSQAIQVTTDMECEEHCFSVNYTHYINIGDVCVCGTVQDSGNCCPFVKAICNTKSFLGPNAVASIAGINLSHVPQLYVGRAHMFSVTTTLGIVDQIRWQFGDSEQETVISGKTSSVQHTYTHSGKFWVTAKACVNSTNACESATIPVRVQVQPSNLTTYITGYNKADVSKNLTDMFASFALGYDFSFYWTKKGSNLVEYKKQGCPTNWFSHRYSCIKLVTTPASSFTAAQTACNSDGGKLLQIDHLEELSEIITTLKASTSTFLLGAQKVGGVWQWKQDGSKTSFSDSDLTSTTNGNCVVLQGSSQKLTSNSCTTTAAYACIKDTLDCPKGGTYHTNKYCYVIPVGTGMQKNWSDAQMYCESTYKGWLANISDASTHTLVTGLLTNSSLSKAWFGLSDRGVEGYYLWADDTSFDLATASFTTVTSNNQDCFFTTSSKTWSSDRCSMSYNFVCQYSQNMDRITVATYTTGAQDLDMAPGTNFEQIVSHDNFPQTASATENYLFPGMIFSKPGKVRSWIFHSINITSSGSHDISLQVFRPSCLSGTLYPPGCASTKFSTCSTSTFTCSPSSSCTSSQYFCYLGNMCKPFNETCTCNSVPSAAAFCSSAVASFPRYKLVGQTQITVAISGEKIFTIPAGDISVQELDVVGIQFPSGQNMIKCENKASGRDQQTVFKATGLGWLDKNSNYSTSTTNEELTCYLQAVFTEDHREYFPENLAFSSAIGKYDFSISIVETESKTLEVSLAEGVSDVFWVYPGLSVVGASNTSLGKINTEWNKTYDFTVRVQRGTDVSSVWSFDSTKTVNLTGTCTTAVTAETGSLCNSSVYWSAKPFAVYTHTINTTGKQTLTLTFSNILGPVIKTLEIETEKRIQGFTFVKTSSSLELNAVAVNEVSVFQTSITDGTGVSYSFKVGGSLASSTNSTLQYTFNTVTTIIVEATVTNILSINTTNLTVYVKKRANLINCIYLNTPYIAVKGIPINLTLECDTVVGAQVKSIWELGDSSSNVTGTTFTTTTTKATFMKDVTFITVTLGQTVKTYTEDPFTSITSQTTVDVYNAIPSVEITLSAFQIAPSGSVNFNSSVPSTPGNYGNVFFIFNFGDGSAADNSSSGSVSHTFTAIGNYSITVTATNGPSSVSVTRFVEVHEQIAGLNLTYDGPKMTNDPITFTANASRGNFLTYQFESTLFNVTQKLSTFSHTFANKGNYLITLTASNALSSQHTTLTAYILSPTEILIVSLKLNGTAISGCYETNLSHTLSVEVIHYDKTRLLYDWDFGNSVVISNSLSTQHQGYTFAGNFTLKVTAKYTPQNASIQQSVDLCLEERISTPEIQLTSPVALPPSGTASKNVTVTVRTGSPLHYQWFTNATTTGSATGSSIGVQFLGEGYYNLNVTLNNNINTVAVSKVVQVIQEISGLAISCTSCITKAGNFYVQRNVANNYMVSISTGSQVTYSWDMGDTNTSQGATKTHRYGATGQYNITVTVSNPVTSSLKKTVTIHVEDPITSVTLDFSGYDWLANLVPATTNIKNLDISKIGKFQVAVQPTGMSLEYSWTFDTGLTPLVSTSNQGSYSYTSLGWKSVTVKASNLLNNMTSATLGFYVITAITDINVTENGNQLSTTSNYTVGINKPYTFTATSNQATPGSVTYLFIVRENNVLVAISNNDTSPSYTYNFTSEKSYRLLISVKNTQTPTNFEKSYNIEPIKSITGAFITAPAGENGNITLGSSITLTGGCTDGKYPKYRWYYAQAPAGELIPTHPTNTTVITITPTQVGMYIIQLEVYNYVSIPQNATYRLNVQTGVSGVSIDVSLPFPDAVEIGSSKTFNAVVTAGTDVTYNWTLYEAGTKIGTGDHQLYNVTFSKQALYNITLEVKNFASSESKFIEIYSLIHVPYFELEVIGGSQISGGSGIAAETGTSLTFLPNITVINFISFHYTINGTSEKNSSSLAKTFSSADHYIVSLNAENKISTQSSQQWIVIQDPISGLVVQGCNHTVLLGTAYTLIASQSKGTEVSYSWTKDGAVSTGPSVVVQYDIVGNYSVNLNAQNYVSDKMLYCYVTYLGLIGNLKITKSHYSYLNFPVTFTVSGVYIDPANFTWTFSHGPGPEHTKYPSLTITFTTAGSYDLSVVVDNGVSQDIVNFTFVMEGLRCSVPKVSPHGSLQRTTLRSRVIEFAVTVETHDCNEYTSANEWVIYQANSCSAPLKNIFNLSSSVHINTPELRVPVRTLSYGTYCVTFRHQYQKTPVTETVKFNLTIEPTDLVTIIAGGDELSTVEGSELTLDGTLSYDPDLEPNTVLGYRWSCLQTAGINTGVCSKINTVTSSLVTLTSLTLTSGDEYNVTLTVTAPGRISSSKSQLIHIASSTIPRVETTCVSCIANGHYTLIASKSVSIEGKCLSGCTALTSYSWTVTDMSTNTPVSVNSTATTTGTNKLNFVLKANALSGSKNYAFKLQATEGSKFGYAQFVLPPSSIPSGGLCTVSKTSNVIPLKDRLMISCQNYVDLDTMSGIYYQVKVISTSKAEEYIAYYGTRSVNWIYLAPFANTSFEAITIQVNVLNDYGSKGTGNTFTVSFAHPTLAANQANNVDFIRDHMISTLPTIVNQNNPVLLVQYCTAALSFLNDQSQQGVSSNEIRMALREVVAHSLSGLPLGNIYTVQQMSNAIEYLAAFPNELSSNILQIVSSEIEFLAKAMETMVKKGHDQTDYEPDKLLNTITNIQRALQLTTTNISDIGTLAMFGDLKKYQLEVSSGVAVKVYGNLEEQIKSMIIKTVEYTNQLMIVPLRSLLADEEPIQIKLSDGSVTMGMHVSVNKLQEDFQVAGVKLDVPPSVVAYTSYSQSSIFELFTASTINPYNFGLDTSDLNTNTLSIGFYSIDGSTVKVANLPDSSAITMYLFDRDSTPYVINSSGLVYSNRYDPLGNMSYSTSSKPLKGNTNYQTSTLTLPSASGESLHVQIRVNFTDSSGELTATLKKNGVSFEESAENSFVRPLKIRAAMMDDLKHDHREYTFYIPPSEMDTSNDVFKVVVSANQNVEVSVGTYFSRCLYFDETSTAWSDDGCTPQAESVAQVTVCKCNHMTSFGGTFLLSPNEIDFTDLTRLDLANNPVAIITCSVLAFLYIVLLIACRRMDRIDVNRISLIPLCGKDGSFKYEVTIVTGRLPGAGTTAHVGIRLHGDYGKSARQHVSKPGAFGRNCSDMFIIAYDVNLGDLKKVQIWHDNTGLSPSWYLSHVIVNDLQTDHKYYFFANSWLSLQAENGSIQKDIKVATPEEMHKFGHRMSTAVFNSLADKHLWLSLLNRPAQSRFTRVQRLTCCFTLLFTFVGMNAMWYGLLKTTNEDLGWDNFGWEEMVLALISNVMVLPFSIGLIYLFKRSKSKSNIFDRIQKPQTAQTLEIENYCEDSQAGSLNSSNMGAIPYDLERESTIDSVPNAPARSLKRSRHVAKTHRENTDDSLYQKPRPSVAVTNSSSDPLWTNDAILQWPDNVPSYEDGNDSRPSTSSTTSNQPTVRQAPCKPGGATQEARKSQGIRSKEDASQLLEYLDKMETDLKETETKSVKSQGSKRSSHSLRKASTTKSSQWGSLEDILNSDDESLIDGGKQRGMKKRGSTLSQASSQQKFNPRSDPRINGNGSHWPKTRESLASRTSAGGSFSQRPGTTGVTAGLRPGYYSEMTMESHDVKMHAPKEKCTLPHWCVYIAYVICLMLSAFSTVMVVLYCFQFGYSESMQWLLALILSLVMSFLVIEPLKAFLIAVYVVAMMKSVEEDEDDDQIEIKPTFDNSNEKIKDEKFRPIGGFALVRAKEEGRRIHRMNIMIRQFVAYVFYLWLMMAIVYIHFSYNSYLMTKQVECDFFTPKTASGQNFSRIRSIEEFWDWTENVYTDSLYLKDTATDEEHGYLLGPARMRLIRGLTSKCQASNAAAHYGASTLTDRTCHGEGQYEEDTGTYTEGWNGSNSNGSWKHYSATQLGSTHKLGHVAIYPGGGYPMELGTTYHETLTIVQDLKDKGWVDLLTRAVIFEFALYSPGSDITAMVAMLVEFPLTGGAIASYEVQSEKLLWFEDGKVDPLMVLECILFLVCLYSWVHLTLQIRELGRQFFKDWWNYYEIATTLMTTVTVGMYIGCVVEATSTFNEFLANMTSFTNFERTAYIHVGTRYLQAWLLFLLMYKVVKQLRFVKFMKVYEETLSAAFSHLLGTGLIFLILLMVYAQVGYLLYGRVLAEFETVGHAANTLLVMIRGHFNFLPMLDHQETFTHFYVYSYYAFAYGIMVALVVAILQSTYHTIKSQQTFKASIEMQDHEMIEFMLKRFKLWAGIQKPKPAFRRVRFPGFPSISSRSSSSYSNRSSASEQTVPATVVEQEFSRVQLNSMMARLTPTWNAVLKRMEKLEVLENDEEVLVKKAENEMKDLNWKCRINELERQRKELLNWKNQPGGSSKAPSGEGATQPRQSVGKRGPNRDNTERKAPATVTGGATRDQPSGNPGDEQGATGGRRPLSYQGARLEGTTPGTRRASSQDKNTQDKNTLQKFLKSVKPSKAAWNK